MIKARVKDLLEDFRDVVKRLEDDPIVNFMLFIAGIAGLIIFAFFVYEPSAC